MRFTPALNAQSPSTFIEPGYACHRSVSSEVNDSAATIGRPHVCAIEAASITL